nr:hypothetical protein [uncultured Draconibacterium sp.]
MKTSNIRIQIKRKLFDNPNPINYRKEYTSLFDFMFPSKNDFVAFLEESNYEKKIQYSKKIIMRLCFESNFPPPSKLLLYILDFETTLSAKTKVGFVSRDHFVHLVNLYLHGIYQFFYQPILQAKTINEFKNIRKRSKKINNQDLTTNSVKDFIKAWKFMVFYHDLGYPIEYYLGKQSSTKEELDDKKRFLEPFNKIDTYIVKDTSLKALTKFIALTQLFNNKEPNKVEDIFFSFIEDSDDIAQVNIDYSKKNLISTEQLDSKIEEEFKKLDLSVLANEYNEEKNPSIKLKSNDNKLFSYFKSKYRNSINKELIKEVKDKKLIQLHEDFSNYVEIENVHGETSLSILSTQLKKNKLLAIKWNKQSEEPVLLVAPLNDGHECFTTKYHPKSTKAKYGNIIDNCFTYKTYSDNYYWKYYTSPDNYNEAVDLASFLNNNGKAIMSVDHFYDLTHYINEITPIKFGLITNETEFRDYLFELYFSFYDSVNFLGDSNENPTIYEIFYNAREPILRSLKKELPNQISKIFEKEFKKEFSCLDLQDFDRDKISEIIENIIFTLSSNDEEPKGEPNVNNLIDLLNQKLDENVKERIDKQISISNLWEHFKQLIEDKVKDSNNFVEIGDLKEIENSHLEDKLTPKEILKNDISVSVAKKLKRNNYGEYEDFISYMPEYSKSDDRKGFYDHGFCSFLIGTETMNLYMDIINYANVSPNTNTINSFLIKLGIGLDSNRDSMEQTYECYNIFKTAMFAVIVHNIYPKYFKTKFKTNIEKTPFNYFSIFADSLQPWDRKRNYNPTFMHLPYSTYGDKFSINFIDNKIYIHEEGTNLNIEKRNKELGIYLDEYLEHASNFIIKSLSEY